MSQARGSSRSWVKSESKSRSRLRTWGALLALALAAGCGGPGSTPGPKQVRLPGLGFAVPEAWETRAPQTSMRIAEFMLPESNEQATLVIFRFQGGGGTADANVARWISQFRQPNGGPSGDVAKVTSSTRESLTLTQLDVRGSYEAQAMPGAPPTPALPDARLLALVVEGSGDPYYFKLLGPTPVIDRWEPAWVELVASLAPNAE